MKTKEGRQQREASIMVYRASAKRGKCCGTMILRFSMRTRCSRNTLVIHTVFSFLLTISVTKSSLQILIKTPSHTGFSNITSRQIRSGISQIFAGEKSLFPVCIFSFKTRILALSFLSSLPLSSNNVNYFPLPSPLSVMYWRDM